ncbi:hypothetical protein GGS20DRAFT_592217 [Poronia punctata]|nr:hypothetical protein GGS20DRAFT_592217 [Poronia punctata]
MAEFCPDSGSDSEFDLAEFHQEIDEHTAWVHDCETQHQTWGAGTPVLHAYDASFLKDNAKRIAEESMSMSQARKDLKNQILAEYLLPDLEHATIQEYYDALESWMVLLDKYFFSGSLTQGPERLVSLRLSANNWVMTWRGMTTYSIVLPHRRMAILLRDPNSGKRYSRAHLFEVLLHEMAHAYVRLFFNRCPLLNNNEYEADQCGGHGHLWETVYQLACRVACRWHPELAYLGRDVPDAEEAVIVVVNLDFTEFPDLLYWGKTLDVLIARYYIPLAGKLPWLKAEWDGEDDPMLKLFHGLFPAPWGRRPGPCGELRKALLRLNNESYEYFVRSRLPYPLTVKRFLCCATALLFCLVAGGFWLRGQLEGLLFFIWYFYPSITPF